MGVDDGCGVPRVEERHHYFRDRIPTPCMVSPDGDAFASAAPDVDVAATSDRPASRGAFREEGRSSPVRSSVSMLPGKNGRGGGAGACGAEEPPDDVTGALPLGFLRGGSVWPWTAGEDKGSSSITVEVLQRHFDQSLITAAKELSVSLAVSDCTASLVLARMRTETGGERKRNLTQ